MTNFEKITTSPEALGELLASLTVIDSPWEDAFHKAFCADCGRENCYGKCCPHQAERNNPTWWLKLGEKPGEVPGLSIKVKAAFPILWGREYYTVAEKKKETRAPCICCDNTGKVTIKGVEYTCPRCKGDWREKEVVGETTVYSVAKWVLNGVEVSSTQTVVLDLMRINSTGSYNDRMKIEQADFRDMVKRGYGKSVKVYDDYKAAMAEVKRLNAAERERQEGAGESG